MVEENKICLFDEIARLFLFSSARYLSDEYYNFKPSLHTYGLTRALYIFGDNRPLAVIGGILMSRSRVKAKAHTRDETTIGMTTALL